MLAARGFAGQWFKALRTGIVLSEGGEFGFALLTLLLQNRLIASEITQPLLAAITLSMVLSPFLIRHNKRIAQLVLRESGPAQTETRAFRRRNSGLAAREHVILCGSAASARMSRACWRARASSSWRWTSTRFACAPRAKPATRSSMATPPTKDCCIRWGSSMQARSSSLSRIRNGRSGSWRLSGAARGFVPVLVRTMDDTQLEELHAAGATEVVPETLEAALTLVSHALLVLDVPLSRVLRTIGEIRRQRYKTLRTVFRREGAELIDDSHALREELHTVVLPPGAWSVDPLIARSARARC